MTHTKHTPGPWSCFHMPGTTSPWWTIRDGRNIYVAEVDWVDHAVLVEEAEANARLIAAAPELLEAAKGLEQALRLYSGRSHRDHTITGNAVQAVIDAIAKAEGTNE